MQNIRVESAVASFAKILYTRRNFLHVHLGGCVTTLTLKPLKQLVNKIVLAQCAVITLLAFVYLIISHWQAVLAVMCGGLIYILPGYFYASRLFSNVSPRAILRIMAFFYVGEVLKLVISIVLFIVLLKMFNFPLLPFFLGYLVAALTFCVTAMFLMNKSMVNTA